MNLKKQKILILGSTEKMGGAASVSWEAYEELKNRGYWVKYLVGYKNIIDKDINQLGQNPALEFFGSVGNTALLYFRHLRSYILSDDISFGKDKELFNHPWYKSADVVHIHNRHGNFLTLKSLVKISQQKHLIWTLHDMWAITSHCAYSENSNKKTHNPLNCRKLSYPPILLKNDKKLWDTKRRIYKEIKNLTIIVPSKWLYNKVIQTPLKKFNIEIINNGINTVQFQQPSKRKIQSKKNLVNRKTAIYIAQDGGRNPRKNFKLFEGIAGRLIKEKYEFIAIGGNKKIQKKNNVTYHPYISDKKILAKQIQAADVLISTSKSEVFGLTLIESLLSGTPVISFDTGIAKEIIENGKNGYVMNNFDIDKWTQATLNILNHRYKYSNYIKKTYSQLVNKYSVETMVDKYIKVYLQK